MAAAGGAGLLLDYRDGPVSWVHLAVYGLLVLGAVRFVRISLMIAAVSREASEASEEPIRA
ncbi:MAG: hypothetical protein ACR2JF_03865 [Iamia sp.]